MRFSLKSILFATTLGLCTFANANVPATNVDLSEEQQSSMQEVAAVQVMGETCPMIIGKNDNFTAGYQALLKEFLPTFADTQQALQALNEDPMYKAALTEARSDMAKATQEYNRGVCLGVIEWHNMNK
ncbi:MULTISPECIES: MCR_0457 family protein [unclassified Acinetobacter]|uniref:MCR_0457 family protein n=1 Tax=unclassified Acinetobacter TaxID=196816 RepID=UPI0035B98E7F